jgi:hypothetical protein
MLQRITTRRSYSLAIAGVATFVVVSPALGACHKFSVWNYPWPQRCAPVRPIISARLTVDPPLPPVNGADVDIPLPDLTPVTDNDLFIEGLDRLGAILRLKEQGVPK